jgi:muramoyltetrapeptide carboxypeptidase
VPKIDDDRPSFTVEEVLRDCLAGLKKPMITRMNVGHIDDQWTLPIGMPVSFDGNAGNFTVAHSAVA